jgi:TolB-like protein/Flp pilus assembly protein TadD
LGLSGFLDEFRRRNVLRAGILYATSAWALVQAMASIGSILGAPHWIARWFLIAACVGLPFWIVFAWFYQLTPLGIRRESEVTPSQSNTLAIGRKLDFWIIGFLTIAVILLLTDRFMGHGDGGPAGVTISVPDKSIAVLPLANESGDPTGLYFSDGLSEDLIEALTQFSGMRVIGRASSFLFRNTKYTSDVIGAKLGVAHLLEGSVRRAGDTVRISAELIDAKAGNTRWSAHYDRPYKDLFRLQDEITNAVAGALRAKLLGGIVRQTDRPPGGNLAAYNAYLEGQFYSRRFTAADLRKAIDAYATATRLDPRYAQAWAHSSITWDNLSSFLAGAAQQQALGRARAYANTALSLAPGLAAAHMARGGVLMDIDSDWKGAESEFRRALQLSPNDPRAKLDLANVLMTTGQIGESLPLQQQAIEANPLGATAYRALATTFSMLGRLDEAEQAIHRAIELRPGAEEDHVVLAMIEIQRGNAKAAFDAAKGEPPGPSHDVAVAEALQVGTDRAAADAALKSVIAKYGNQQPGDIAEVYAVRKDADRMFQWLNRALAIHDGNLQAILYDALLLPYQQDPRFAKVCRALKLPVPQPKS